MAKKKQETPKQEEAIGLDVQLNKSEAFIEKNWKVLAGALVAIIVVVSGIYLYKNYAAGKEVKAQAAIAAAQTAFAAQQYDQALKGEGANLGLLKVIDEYSGTKTANLAKLYAAVCYANTGKTDEAIKMFEDFSGKGDEMISPAAIGALGNCYIQKGQKEKGVDLLLKAAKEADNDAISPVFLLQAGEVYESLGQNDKAVELYKQIKEKYFRSQLASQIDMYIERATK